MDAVRPWSINSLDVGFFTSQFRPVGRPGSKNKNKFLLALIFSFSLTVGVGWPVVLEIESAGQNKKNGFLTFIFLSEVFPLHRSIRHLEILINWPWPYLETETYQVK